MNCLFSHTIKRLSRKQFLTLYFCCLDSFSLSREMEPAIISTIQVSMFNPNLEQLLLFFMYFCQFIYHCGYNMCTTDICTSSLSVIRRAITNNTLVSKPTSHLAFYRPKLLYNQVNTLQKELAIIIAPHYFNTSSLSIIRWM